MPGHDGALEAELAVDIDNTHVPGEFVEPTTPVVSATEVGQADTEADPAKAKRGRRGGRRRRKPGEDAEAAVVERAPSEALFAAYVGPTPADPFALSSLDIFDALEQAEMGSAIVVAEAPQPPIESDAEPKGDLASTALPVDSAVLSEVPQPLQSPKDVPENRASSAEPLAGSPVQPILIGADMTKTERKKGWWRR